METLSQIGKQVSELFSSLTPSARIMAALMAGVIVVSLGWILANQENNNKVAVMGQLTPDEIRRAERAFGAASLGDYDIEGSRIKVPFADRALYLKALADGGGMPMRPGEEMEKALEGGIFDPPSVISKREGLARQNEFAYSLQELDQVEKAFVSFDEQKKGFAQETEKVCSIRVKGYNDHPISTSVLRYIAEAATTHFAGLRPENVTVFDLGSANLYRPSNDPHGIADNPVLQAEKEWREHYLSQLRELLNHYGAVKLSANVVLDPTLVQETEKLQYDPKGVATQTSLKKSDIETAKLGSGGRPGANPNGVVGSGGLSVSQTSPEQTSKAKDSEENTQTEFGKEAVITKTAGLIPKEVNVSVGVPDEYYYKKFRVVWLRDNPGSTDEPPAPTPVEMAAIKTEVEDAIKSAVATIPVNVQAGEDRRAYIDVYSYTELPLPEIPGPSIAETSLAWLGESWSTLAMIALVLISLGMMFSWVKAQPGSGETERRFAEGFGLRVPEQMADELDLSDGAADELGDGEEGKPGKSFDVTGADIKEDLSNLIKENPDAAVNLLKTWIGEAA